MSFIKCFFGVLDTQESFHEMCTIVIIVNIPSVMYHIGFFFLLPLLFLYIKQR